MWLPLVLAVLQLHAHADAGRTGSLSRLYVGAQPRAGCCAADLLVLLQPKAALLGARAMLMMFQTADVWWLVDWPTNGDGID